MTVRYRATLAYDGTAYHGFQRQSGDLPTIQSVVEQTIAAVTGAQGTVIGAGRTDTGVHATGQVIAFDAAWKHGEDALLRAINVMLPGDIALQDLRQHEGFHPRYDAVSRVYSYSIVQSPVRQPLTRFRAWHVWGALDLDAMQNAAALLPGEHDFAAFGKSPKGETTIRHVTTSIWTRHEAPHGWDWTYTIEANGFLQHMVRRIVGTLVHVGHGWISGDTFEMIFRTGDRKQAVLAPPHGLVLSAVRYHDE